MNIFLLGYMGCGKTTLGRLLAKKIQFDFIDLDKIIAKQNGRSVEEIFNTEGEKAFRQYERVALLSLVNVTNSVIATGGGTPCFYSNMEWMNKHGETIFLHPPLDSLLEKLTKSNKIIQRPLLKNKTQNEMLRYIKKSWAERLQWYQKAKHTISSKVIKPDNVIVLLPALFEN